MDKKLDNEKISLANKELFDLVANEYEYLFSEEFNWYVKRLLRSYIKNIIKFFGSSAFQVLDIGAGTGRITMEFLARGIPVTAVDISPQMLSILREKANKLNYGHLLTIKICKPEEFFNSCNQQFSVVCFGGVLHHLANYEEVFLETLKLLTPKAVCLIFGEPLSWDFMKITKFTKFFLSPINQVLATGNILFHFPVNWRKKLKQRKIMAEDKVIHKQLWDGNFNHKYFISSLEKRKYKIEYFRKRVDLASGTLAWLVNSFNLTYIVFDLIALRETK